MLSSVQKIELVIVDLSTLQTKEKWVFEVETRLGFLLCFYHVVVLLQVTISFLPLQRWTTPVYKSFNR
jgi:NADH:ubiquinone oxidoreductase subunit 2 (subunit N)